MSRYSSASSSGASASKRLVRSTSSALAMVSGISCSDSSSSPLVLPGASSFCQSGTVVTSSSSTSGSSSEAPPKTSANTASKTLTWVSSVTTTERMVQYSVPRLTGRTSVSARATSAARAGGTGSPASCRRRLSAPTSAGRSSWIVSTPNDSVTAAHELVQAGRANHLLVLAVLEHRPEGRVHGLDVQALHPEQVQGREPVDCLGDPRRLLDVAVAHARDSVGDLDRQRLRRALDPPAHDLDLALGRRVRDAVIEAAALDRVVQVARAVRGQHDHRRVGRADGAELGNGHRRLAQELEQERLEVVVGAVDLVDEQHRRTRAGVLERAQQRAADEVVGAEQLLF